MVLIKCENLTYGYNGKPLTEPLNFSVEAGDYLCIVGENGSGKSTLVKTILQLHEPLGGSIGTEAINRGEIGYLPQKALLQRDFPASVEEIVLSGCQARSGLRPFYTDEDHALAEQSMQRLGLQSIKKSCYSKLSGGQQQRVLLARALCAGKRLLILDEPVAGLDPKVTLELYRLVATLNKEEAVTLVMVSHDIKAAVTYAKHILHIGKTSFFGTVSAYVESELGKNFLAIKGGR